MNIVRLKNKAVIYGALSICTTIQSMEFEEIPTGHRPMENHTPENQAEAWKKYDLSIQMLLWAAQMEIVPEVSPELIAFAIKKPLSAPKDQLQQEMMQAQQTVAMQIQELGSDQLARQNTQERLLCPKCSRSTSSKETLRKHIKNYHDPRNPIVCSIMNCGWRFAGQEQLEGHIRRSHPRKKF